MPYVFNPFTGSLDSSPSTKNGESAYSTVQSNSATTWNYQGTDLKNLSGNWDSVYNNVNSNSAYWAEAYNNLVSNSANYLSGFDLSFLSVSANWNSVYSNVNANSGNWESAYNISTDYQNTSALYATIDFANGKFLPLSGGIVSGDLTITGYVSAVSGLEIVAGNGGPSTLYVENNKVGINTETPNEALTVVGSISSNNVIYSNGGNSDQWNSSFTTVQANSAQWAIDSTTDGGVRALTSFWDSTYSTVYSNSATNWNYQGSDLKTLSGNWDSVYSNVNSNSAHWTEAYSNLVSNSANYLSGFDLSFLSVSANWNSVYSTVNSNSATTWNYQGSDIKALTANWVGGNIAYTNLISNSAAYLSAVDLSFLSVSGNWNSTYTTVCANSSNWSSTYTVLQSTSGIAQVVIAKVYNSESVTMPRGSVVYTYGATGDVMSVKFASNSADSYSATTLGIINDPILSGAVGYATIAGQVDKLNFGTFNEGDPVYLGNTPGSITNVKPVAPLHSVYLGVVERANNGNGLLYVKVQNGYEIDELHNVLITSVSAGQILRRNNVNNLWINTDDGAKWDSAYSTVNSNSATTWNYQGSDLKALSANWQNTFTTVQTTSSTWNLASSAVQNGGNVSTIRALTQSEYNALTPDPNTVYIITS